MGGQTHILDELKHKFGGNGSLRPDWGSSIRNDPFLHALPKLVRSHSEVVAQNVYPDRRTVGIPIDWMGHPSTKNATVRKSKFVCDVVSNISTLGVRYKNPIFDLAETIRV